MLIPSELYRHILEVLPIACVDVLIIHDKKCLLLLRENEPAKGTFWFPGGRIFKNESIETAALRKAKEETNLSCKFEKIVSVEESFFPKSGTMATDIHTINICCLLIISDSSPLKLDHLHSSFKWITELSSDFHPAIINPLKLIGFK